MQLTFVNDLKKLAPAAYIYGKWHASQDCQTGIPTKKANSFSEGYDHQNFGS